MKRKIEILLAFTCLCIQNIQAQNLLNNGNFENGGNGVGFSINSSFYNNINPPYSGTTSPGNYSVTNNPQPMNTAFFISGGDHTTGTGNMLVVDATSTGGQQRFWRAGNNGEGICNLTPGANYSFHYWIKSVSTQVTGPNSQAIIGYQIIGASNITLFAGSATAPLPADGWQEVVYTFTATNNCVNIELWDNNTQTIGNDFAVDDFALFGPPEPFNLEYSTINPSCVGAQDGSIIGYGSGANPPYTFWITGPVSANNGTGIFTGLPAGTYTLNILEGADGEIHINDIVLSEPQNLILSQPTTICPNQTTTLSVSGSNSGYQWTSNPIDNNLNPTAASQLVSPLQTTVYSVSSDVAINRNLIFNHDFSLGDQGFVTNYIYYAPNNPTGAQRAYGIVTNPQTWESGFALFGDHTGNNGLMMVVDGSPQNSGNDKVWSQSVPVTPNQNYTFSYWVRTAALPSPANLEVTINGSSIGIDTAPNNTLTWVNRSYTWNSGNNTIAHIVLLDKNTVLTGNDFALDDLSFVGPTTNCIQTKSVTITVNNQVVPDFPPAITICSGGTVPTLSNTSPNGITGTWLPSVVSNTNSAVYTFTPNPGQCAGFVEFTVTVNDNNITPTFTQVGPFCAGENISDPLPLLSENGVLGHWTPIFDIHQTTTYTFIPNPGQCAGTVQMTVQINPKTTPTFSQIGPFCSGHITSNPLPTLSSEGISGIWSPTFNNQATTTYTFTPNENQCAQATTVEVVIIENNLTPVFDFGPYMTGCYRPISETPPIALPEISDNGIYGYWSPATIDYSTVDETLYTFYPLVNTCASLYMLTINIIEVPDFTVHSDCIDDNLVLSVKLFEVVEDSHFTWYNEQNEIISTDSSVLISEKGTYKVVKEINGCTREQTVVVTSVNCKIPKGISPNEDTFNDSFDLSNLDVKRLEIFNRYGTEVYAKSNYKKEWSGKDYNDHYLPDGVYFYVIDFYSGKNKTGWVYISREH